MAEEFDADSLESIDALLDEAALDETVPEDDEGPSAEELANELDQPSGEGVQFDPLEDLEGGEEEALLDSLDEADDIGDDLLDGLDSDDDMDELLDSFDADELLDNSSLAEEAGLDDSPDLYADEPESTTSNVNNTNAPTKQLVNPETELTVDEMDALKKLIIIFSSIIIFLVLAVMGVGVWGALSSGGFTEENALTLEEIKAGTDQNTRLAVASDQDLKSIEKKLDALSFQMEQLNSDFYQMMQGVGSLPMAQVDAHGNAIINPIPAPMPPIGGQPGHAMNAQQPVHMGGTGHPPQAPMGQAQPAMPNHAAPMGTQVYAQPAMQAPVPANLQPETVIAKIDPALEKKMGAVQTQIGRTQKYVKDMNYRLKQMQKQYNYLLESMKKVEKEVVASQLPVSQAKGKGDVVTPKAQVRPVHAVPSQGETVRSGQYSVPDGMFYDRHAGGSYP